MIIGLGTDLCDVRRIEAALTRYGGRFAARICSARERAKAERRANTAGAYALMFAAKEACAKALGTGFRQGVFFRDMEVLNRPSGKPYLVLSGGALRRLEALTPKGLVALTDLSLSDEFPLAQAVVILQAVPGELAGLRHD